MKKILKIIIVISLFLLLLIVYMCNRTYKYEFDSDISFFEDKDITIELLSITPTGATVFITDNSELGYSFGDYRIQKKQLNRWKYLRSNLKNNILLAIELGRDENNEYAFHCKWGRKDDTYGKLNSGTYRFIISASYPEVRKSIFLFR